MIIRAAQARDLESCDTLDPSYDTDYVWQMETARGDGKISVGFRVTRLPRAMRVPLTLDEWSRGALHENFERGECFMVASDGDEISGFVDATLNPWEQIARVNHLIVRADRRRRGIASELLRAVLHWALVRDAASVMVAVSTKNYPASALFQTHGFSFCGYNDQYYSNRDIALFFALSLK